MDAARRPVASPDHRLRLWLPGQHGAWAMLAVPLLLGVAAARLVPLQLLLAIAAASGYLAVATAESAVRARDRSAYLPSLALYAVICAVSGLPLLATDPALLLAIIVVVAPGVLVALERRRTSRPRGERAAQLLQALVLTPAAASLAGPWLTPAVGAATLLALLYLAGTVLVVRSALRERGNQRFAALSVAWHLGALALAARLFPPVVAAAWAVLAARAIGVPAMERELEQSGRHLRPVQLGIVETLAAGLLVVAAFVARP